MSTLSCSNPGCVALATHGDMCSIHAGLASGRIVPVEEPSQPQGRSLDEVDARLRRKYPRLRRFVTAIERANIPMPVVSVYAFHSPFATIYLANDNPEVYDVLHVFYHFQDQVRRYRRRRYVGLVEPLHVGGPQNRYVPWDEIDACRDNGPEATQLTPAELCTLASHSSPCPACGCDAAALSWFRYMSPAMTWQRRSGKGGWMAVCDDCREQVAFFIDIEN